METSKLEKVIARIKQLRAISESTHSKAEKETTLAIASKLIAQYQLDEAEIQASTGKNEDPIDLTAEHIIYESGRIVRWKNSLAVGLAELNGLFIYNAQVRGGVSHRSVSRYRVIGRASDIAIAVYVMAYLTSEISRLAEEAVPSRGVRGVNPDRESWCLGCVAGFLAKMKAEKDAVMKQATSTAMVLLSNRAKEAEEVFFAARKGKPLGSATYRPKGTLTYGKYQAGFDRGQKLTVSPGMSGDKTETKKLT